MARFQNGWIKVSRATICGDIGDNPYRLAIFMKLCAWAIIQESVISWKGRPRTLPPGAVLTGFRELANAVACDRKTIKKHLDYLKLRGVLTLEISSFGILVLMQRSNEIALLPEGVGHAMDRAMDRAMDHGMDRDAPLIEELKNKRKENICSEASPSESCGAIPELAGNPLIEEFLGRIRSKTQATWLALYRDQKWICEEILKAVAWLDSNRHKAPKKDFGRFMNAWLSRSWEKHRKAIPSHNSSHGRDLSLEEAMREFK